MKKAFITGITGQDGSYLAAFLNEKGVDTRPFYPAIHTQPPFHISMVTLKILSMFRIEDYGYRLLLR